MTSDTVPRPPHPLTPTCDLRSVLVRRLQERGLTQLQEAEERRRTAFADDRWKEHCRKIRAHVYQAMGPMPFGSHGGPLRTREVSTHQAPSSKPGRASMRPLGRRRTLPVGKARPESLSAHSAASPFTVRSSPR